MIRHFCALFLLTIPVHASVLWYNGDWDHANGLANSANGRFGSEWLYEDFVVSDPLDWNVTGVFTNVFVAPNFPVVSVNWEIRSGLSTGNGGTLIAGGAQTGHMTPTGTTLGLDVEETVVADGLSVRLSPGEYWLAVYPVGNGTGDGAFTSATVGANCVGSPCGNDHGGFFFAPPLPFEEWQPLGADFSFGVVGTVVTPEPATWIGMALGSIALLFRRRR